MITTEYCRTELRGSVMLLMLIVIMQNVSALSTSEVDPSAPGYKGRKGTTIYVSKSGDNSDGSSWEKAFNNIQAALLAIPDDKGGHRIIIRPDTYVEWYFPIEYI
jgi:hypothetical protein